MNQVILIGRITADPEVRYTNNQNAFCHFTLAVDRTKDITDFIRCNAWNKTAEIMAQHVHKGERIAVTGQIQTGTYTDKNGQKINTTEISVGRLEFIEPKQQAPQYQQPQQQKPQQQNLYQPEEFVPVTGPDDDLPF